MSLETTIEKAAARAAAEAIKKYLADLVLPAQEYLNTRQAAAYIGFSEEYLEIARHKADGSGPTYIKHPRSVRYRKADLDAWMGKYVRQPDQPTSRKLQTA